VKVEHVKKQKLGSKANLQKMTVEHVEVRDLNIKHTN
jgi:hypothetical protein